MSSAAHEHICICLVLWVVVFLPAVIKYFGVHPICEADQEAAHSVSDVNPFVIQLTGVYEDLPLFEPDRLRRERK